MLLPGVVIRLACAAARLGRFRLGCQRQPAVSLKVRTRVAVHFIPRIGGGIVVWPAGPARARVFTASVPGGVITASQTGSGAPVLLLHGGPGLSDYTAPLTAELDDAFTVIRFQQRGLEPSTTSGPFDIDRHVADAVAVLDAADAGQAYVIGHSWGGHLAMHLAARHQDRLLGLVAVDPLGAVPDGGASDLDRILAERVPPELAARAQELDQRAMAGEGTAEDALEGLAIVWPGYSSPHPARPRQCRR